MFVIGDVEAMFERDERPRIEQEQRSAEFEAFFRDHHRELARIAYSLTGRPADADDVTGDALVAVWRHWERVRSADHPLAYACRIVINLAALRVRQAVRERRVTDRVNRAAGSFDPGPDIVVGLDLQAAILMLPAGRRACVVLRHVVDMSEVEVARTLGISVGTVKSQTSKGLSQLRGLLAEGERRSRHDR